MKARISKILNVKFADPKMEKEFIALKCQNGRRDFNATVFFLIMMNVFILLPKYGSDSLREVLIASISIGVMVLLFFFQQYIKKHVQYFTLVALIIFNLTRFTIIGFNFDTVSKATVFFQGYLVGSAQAVVLSRVTNLYYKFLVLLLILAVRYGVLAGVGDQTRLNPVTLLRQITIDVFLMFMFYSSDKTEKDIFQNFFENRDELVKFKELLAKSLPQSVTVIDFHTRRPLFSNNAFLNSFNHKEEETNAVDTENLENHIKYKTPLRYLHMDPSTLRDVGSNTKNFMGYFDPLQSIFSLEEAINKLVEHDLLAEESVISMVASSENGLSGANIEKQKTFEVILKKIKWDRLDAIAIILNDITYQESLIALKLANSNKDKIIATVSHELRTPLHGIIGLLEISQAKVQDPKVKHHLSLCKDNANLLHSLVNSILDLQQLSTGKLRLNFGNVNVRKTLNDVAQLFNFQCSEKKIELKVFIDENVQETIVNDENRFKQILINLIGNAIKFTFEGGVTIHADKDFEDPKLIRISVSDTGIGIKDQDKHKLFKMYGKLEDGEGVNKNGVGLGLTISSTLAALLNGKSAEKGIELVSEYQKGSKFTFKVHIDLESLKSVLSEQNVDARAKEVKNNINGDSPPPQFRKNSSAQYLMHAEVNNRLEESVIKYDLNEYIGSMVHLEEKIASYSNFAPRETFGNLKRRITIQEPQEYSNVLASSRKNSKENLVSKLTTSVSPQQLKECILVVDDNPFNLLVAKSLIKDLGYSVKAATTGFEALDMVKSSVKEGEVIKMIFMDCQMPIMDGFETTRNLKKMMDNREIPSVPILAWTANNGEEDVRRCYECGMSGHLMKPTTQAAILQAISS